MTFDYDEFADNLWVSLSEPALPCVYVESETAGVLLRVEEATGVIRGFEISSWKRRVAAGAVIVPEVTDSAFEGEWIVEMKRRVNSRV